MKKCILSVLLAASVVISASCVGSSHIAPSAKDKRVVMNINEKPVQYQEFRYYFMNNKKDNFGEGSTLTDENIGTLLTLSENNARQHTALLLMAEDYKAGLTKEQKADIDQYVDEYRKNNFADDEAYKLALDAQYMTDYLFREMSAEATLAENIIKKMKETGKIPTDTASIDAALNGDGLICIKEIYISYTGEETKAASEKKAEEALLKLMEGEDFEKLMGEYSDYSDKTLSHENGYYTARYDALEEIWEIASGLAVGEYSRVVESPYGFHIIKRCEKDSEYMNANREELYDICAREIFWEEYYALSESLTVEYTEYGKNLNLGSLS